VIFNTNDMMVEYYIIMDDILELFSRKTKYVLKYDDKIKIDDRLLTILHMIYCAKIRCLAIIIK
jgi:hypothetical protein